MRSLFLILLILLPIGSAHACRYERDTRPLAEQLADPAIKDLFIGRVTAVDPADGRATFMVRHNLKNPAAPPQEFVTEAVTSTCDIRFNVDEEWLFAGASVNTPSRRLAPPDDLIRADDSELNLPPAWQACTSDADCESFDYSCNITAINKAHRQDAVQKVWVEGGKDPRAASCAAIYPKLIFSAPLCEQGVCGWHGIVEDPSLPALPDTPATP